MSRGNAINHSPGEEYPDPTSIYSIASTANDLVLEHGRQFPNYRYMSSPFPRGDRIAEEHETSLHNLLLRVFDNKLYTAPLEEPQNILDVRSGQQGLWAKTVAEIHEDAQVTGLDVFTPDTEGRENLKFILQNFNDEWILDEITQSHGKLDFVYARTLFGSSQDYPRFYKQCLEHLAPGGYFEQTDIVPYPSCDDDSFKTDSIVNQICALRPALEQAFNTDYNLAMNMKQMIEEAGFVDIEEKITKVPWSPWAPPGTKEHDMGRIFQRFYETGLQGWIIAPLIRHHNFTQEQVDTMCEAAFIELQRNDQHWYSECITVTAHTIVLRTMLSNKPPVNLLIRRIIARLLSSTWTLTKKVKSEVKKAKTERPSEVSWMDTRTPEYEN